MSRKMDCGGCFYYEAQQQMIVGQNIGSCHRFPPQGQMIGGPQGVQLVSNFPPTQATHYCGEYKPKEDEL